MNIHGGVVFTAGVVLGASLMVSIGSTGQPSGSGRYGAFALRAVKGNDDIVVVDTETGQLWRRSGVAAIDLGTPNEPKSVMLNLSSAE